MGLLCTQLAGPVTLSGLEELCGQNFPRKEKQGSVHCLFLAIRSLVNRFQETNSTTKHLSSAGNERSDGGHLSGSQGVSSGLRAQL